MSAPTLVDLRADLRDAREMLAIGGLTDIERQAIERHVRELEQQLGPDAPAANIVLPLAMLADASLWKQLAILNAELESSEMDAAARRAKAQQRDRVWNELERLRKLERAA